MMVARRMRRKTRCRVDQQYLIPPMLHFMPTRSILTVFVSDPLVGLRPVVRQYRRD